MIHKESKFVLQCTKTGIELIEGKWPTKHQQLWKGEDTKGNKCEAAFDDDVGLSFYWNCWSTI